jgi:hypothetical protein
MRLDSSASESVESLVPLTKYHPVFPVSSDYSLSVRGRRDFECHSGEGYLGTEERQAGIEA